MKVTIAFVAISMMATAQLAAQKPGPEPQHRFIVEAIAGAAVPADSSTRTGLSFQGAVKVSVSSSFEVGVYGGAWSGKSTFGPDSKESYFGATVERIWTWGRWRSFVSAGAGLYDLKFQFEERNRFAANNSQSRVGGFAGVGIQLPLSHGCSAVTLAQYHLTAGPVNEARSGFLNVGAGIRAAF